MRALKTITFIYEQREDRVAAAINAGRPNAWSCWLTRRLSLALLNCAPDYLIKTSDLAQRASVEHRPEIAAFEHDAAIAETARAISQTPPEILKSSASSAELAERLTISPAGNRVRFELQGQSGETAVGVLTPAELQRIVQMLQDVVAKAGWIVAVTESLPSRQSAATGSKPVRH